MTSEKRKNRNTYDIIASILKASIKGATRTQILYQANLSFKLRNEYLDALVNSGLLECRELGRRTLYFIAKDGTAFLENYRRINPFYRKISKHLPHANGV